MQNQTLFSNAVFLSPCYWYFWFRRGPEQEGTAQGNHYHYHRSAACPGHQPSGLEFTPFRVRPMFEAALRHRPFSVQPISGLENWSSFPSDHAAYLCALALGLIFLSWRLAIPITVFAAGWICLPRMYLGVHYASDIVVGAAIGVVTVWSVLRAARLWSFLTSQVLAFVEAKPQRFIWLPFWLCMRWVISSGMFAGPFIF